MADEKARISHVTFQQRAVAVQIQANAGFCRIIAIIDDHRIGQTEEGVFIFIKTGSGLQRGQLEIPVLIFQLRKKLIKDRGRFYFIASGVFADIIPIESQNPSLYLIRLIKNLSGELWQSFKTSLSRANTIFRVLQPMPSMRASMGKWCRGTWKIMLNSRVAMRAYKLLALSLIQQHIRRLTGKPLGGECFSQKLVVKFTPEKGKNIGCVLALVYTPVIPGMQDVFNRIKIRVYDRYPQLVITIKKYNNIVSTAAVALVLLTGCSSTPAQASAALTQAPEQSAAVKDTPMPPANDDGTVAIQVYENMGDQQYHLCMVYRRSHYRAGR